MELVDLRKPGEKKKLISAAVLGLAAIIVLWWAFFGFGSSTPTRSQAQPSASPQRAAQSTQRPNAPTVSPEVQNAAIFTEVSYVPLPYNPPDAKRNIFAYYEPPKAPVAAPSTPTPTPAPPPPMLLASVSPSNVYARTADFKLDVAGDKFTPAVRIFVDGRELPTTYKSPQELSTTIPASFIANPGTRTVSVRTPDNTLFSNDATINVAAPPTPNFTYIGIISPENRIDIAVVQDRNNKDLLNAYKGDVIGGRFRVSSISDKELVLVDTTLKIKHTLPKTEGDKTAGALARPTPRVDSEDDEP